MTDKLTTEVIGFRQWKVGRDLQLESSASQYEWTPGVNTAACTQHGPPTKKGHQAPQDWCECGLYALHAPEFWYGDEAVAGVQGSYITFGMAGGEFVSGLVSAWGKLEVHHAGFRAQHAQVVAIALPAAKRDATIARAVAAEYGVALIPRDELERVAAEFGSTVPEEMRPEKPAEGDGRGTIITGNLFVANTGFITGSIPPGTYQISAPMFSWGSTPPEEPEPEPTVFDEIRKRRAPKYDPRNFQPKRKGGKR